MKDLTQLTDIARRAGSFILSVAEVQTLTGTTYTAANSLVSRLVKLGILQETTGYKRNRVFRYAPYIAIFGDNTSDTTAGATA